MVRSSAVSSTRRQQDTLVLSTGALPAPRSQRDHYHEPKP